MAEVKMGTQYVREMAETFRTAAADCKFPDIKAKLVALAADMDVQAGKIWFKTQKGNEEMEAFSKKVDGFEAKLKACDQAGAESLCAPIFAELEKTLNFVKTMKVRMT